MVFTLTPELEPAADAAPTPPEDEAALDAAALATGAATDAATGAATGAAETGALGVTVSGGGAVVMMVVG